MIYSFLVIGALLVIFGLMTIQKKQYGKEEGMRILGKPFTGRFAVFLGIFQLVWGIIFILIFLVKKFNS